MEKNISLIWKNGFDSKNNVFKDDDYFTASKDFNLRVLLKILSKEPYYTISSDEFLSTISNSSDDIVYRNEISNSLMKNSNIVTDLEKLIDDFRKMEFLHNNSFKSIKLKMILQRYEKLGIYANIMQLLKSFFNKDSEVEFKSFIEKKYEDENIEQLMKDLKKVSNILAQFKSLKIGANIDVQFRINEAIILSVNSYKYEEGYITDKMVKSELKTFLETPIASINDIKNANESTELTRSIYKELQKLLSPHLIKINNILNKHYDIITSDILCYYKEVKLYYSIIRFTKYIEREKKSYCYANICNEKTSIEGLYSIHMLDENKVDNNVKVISNDFSLKNNEIAVITGPNNGGKTVFVQALLNAQLLFQNGFPIPAKKASLKVFNKIFSHFPKDEDLEKGSGRLGEEIERISKIVKQIDNNSLIVMNEPFVTTNPNEGLLIMQKTIKKLLTLNCNTLIVTHFLDIYSEFESNSNVISYILEIKNNIRTYKVKKESPLDESYAKSIAKSYGISYEDIIEKFKKRGVII